jgi:PAB-dependent poly(A)-specific ribonuclease subunit 2
MLTHTHTPSRSPPPAQGPSWRGRKNFTPLAVPREAPRPGMLVAIDAEFVAISRAEASIGAGMEVQLKPSRWGVAVGVGVAAGGEHGRSCRGRQLGCGLRPVAAPTVPHTVTHRLALARVSVLRGSGAQAGTAFIDDYVATVEPVVDYLTRWSGIRPGGWACGRCCSSEGALARQAGLGGGSLMLGNG